MCLANHMHCLPERLRSIGNQGRSASVGSWRRQSARSRSQPKVQAEVCNMAMFFDQLKQVVRRLRPRAHVYRHHAAHAGHRRRRQHGHLQRDRGRAAEAAALSPCRQLIGVWHTAPGINIKDLNMAPSIYFIDREQNTTLQDIGVYDGDCVQRDRHGRAGACARPRRHRWHAAACSGVKPALGRLFTPPGRYRRSARRPCCSPTPIGSRNSAERLR